MNLFGKLFNRKKKLIDSPELKVCIIDESTTDLWTTFGITEERRDEIVEICKEAYKLHDIKSHSYVYIVDKCKHVNEVVTATIVFERMCEQTENHPLAGLMKLFGS
jgi:hypothetical protein